MYDDNDDDGDVIITALVLVSVVVIRVLVENVIASYRLSLCCY